MAISDDELFAQCEMETFRAGGKGGQHQNKTETGVRLRHLPTGLVTTSRRERSQWQNRRICLENLRRKIDKLNERKTPRVPTKVPRRKRAERLEEKGKRAETKKLRKRPPPQSD